MSATKVHFRVYRANGSIDAYGCGAAGLPRARLTNETSRVTCGACRRTFDFQRIAGTGRPCTHWKQCGDCHSPALVAGLRGVEERLRADIDRLTRERDEALETVRVVGAFSRLVVRVLVASEEWT